MKKGVLLNANISMAVAQMGHTDALVIADAGLPIPESGWRIDMALTHGVPGFMQVVESVGIILPCMANFSTIFRLWAKRRARRLPWNMSAMRRSRP